MITASITTEDAALARSVTMARADELAGVLGGAGAESRFLTASDGVNLHYPYWRSGPSPSWAVLIFLHGIASHAGWFSETAAQLSEHGVAVYGPDRRGSGRSRGHLARYERALDDLEQMVQLVVSEHPRTPVFLAPSSWAAKLAWCTWLGARGRCRGWCCSPPACDPG